MHSYYQDRVGNEAFVETASQRFSLRQHAVLLGTRLDDGHAPTTLLSFDVSASGFVPAGLQVRMRTSPDEVPVSFTVAERTRVLAENASSRLRVAAFPGAVDAEVPAGATELLLWGHDVQLLAGDRLALVQGSFAQVVTIARTPVRLEEPGWVREPGDRVRPGHRPADPDHAARSGPSRSHRPSSRGARTSRSSCTRTSSTPVYGTPRRAVDVAHATPRRNEVAIAFTRALEHRHASERRRGVPSAGAARAGVAGRPRRRRDRLERPRRAAHRSPATSGRGSTTSTPPAPTTCTSPRRPTRKEPCGCASATGSTGMRWRRQPPSSRLPRSS